MDKQPQVGGGRYEEFAKLNEYAELSVTAEDGTELPTKIEKTDIKPHAIGRGETEIVLQRHGAYVRDKDAENTGSLPEDSAAVEKAASLAFFDKFLSQLPEEERGTVDILVVASDTSYFDKGKRSYETGILALEAAKETLTKYGIPETNIIQESDPLSPDGAPRNMPRLREPNFLNDSPEFLDFMLKEYGGINLDFWVAFESDTHKDVRESMGAEGPDDIADRMSFTVRSLARYADTYHQLNPDRRLIIWGATHYDTISPYVKRDVFEVGKEAQLLVDYGGGITIDIDKSGQATTELGNKTYDIKRKKTPKA